MSAVEWLDSFFARDIQRLFRLRDFNRFNALAFRASHPHGHNFLVVPSVPRPYTRRFGANEVTVCTPPGVLGPAPG